MVTALVQKKKIAAQTEVGAKELMRRGQTYDIFLRLSPQDLQINQCWT